MITQSSHLLAFLVLAVAAVWDLKTTEVPDWLSLVGVCGGIVLHVAASISQGSPTPILWSLGVGAVFSLYGWGMYFMGMWGGADAYATSVLGFAAPYALSGPSLLHPANMFINLMIVGVIYTLGFAVMKTVQNGSALPATFERIRQQRRRFLLEITGAVVFSAGIQYFTTLNGYFYLAAIIGMIILVRFLRTVENTVMTQTKPVEEVEEGEVVAEVDKKIRGASNEELSELDVEEVQIRSGVKFVPAFPIALLVTDLLGGGLGWIVLLVS